MKKFLVSEVIESRVDYVVDAHDAKEAEDKLRYYKSPAARNNNPSSKGEVRFSSTNSHITTKELRTANASKQTKNLNG